MSRDKATLITTIFYDTTARDGYGYSIEVRHVVGRTTPNRLYQLNFRGYPVGSMDVECLFATEMWNDEWSNFCDLIFDIRNNPEFWFALHGLTEG